MEEYFRIKNDLGIISCKTTPIDFHKALQIVAIANDKTIYIIDLRTKMTLQRIISHDGSITLLHFVQNSPYLIAGTQQGRVMQYRYDSRSTLSRLCSFTANKPVSAIDSYEEIIASSGYGGEITIIKLYAQRENKRLQKTRVRINAMRFISKHLLIVASADNNVHFYNLKNNHTTKTLSSPIDQISQILPIEHTHFALVAGRSNKLALLDLHEQKFIATNFICFDAPANFVEIVGGKTVVAALQDNSIAKVELSTPKQLQELIDAGKLADGYNLIEKNPILRNTQEHQRLEELYNILYNKTIAAFKTSNNKEVLSFIQSLGEIPTKQDDAQKLLKAFEFFHKFNTAFIEQKYTLAYSLCEKYPALKHTFEYKQMEKRFKKNFSLARKHIQRGKRDVARDILHPYITISSKRALIKLLLHQNDPFLQFLRALQEKDYKTIASLTKEYPVLQEMQNYQEMMQKIETKLITIQESIYDAKIETAIDMIKKLQHATIIKEQLQELYSLALHAQELTILYEQEKFAACYTLLDRYGDELERLNLAILLEQHWSKLMQRCEHMALQGDLKGIKEVLGELIGIKSRSSKIGDILRLSFRTKIEQLLAKKSLKQCEQIIYSYIDIFGADTELKTLMDTYEKLTDKKLAITHNQKLFSPRDAWLDSEFIMGEYQVIA
ncbi:MAG: hypothetical protein FAF05_01485 [Epsilonproteobacteria bacterium]|nr:hypothetical protein [Campylobacterota bacterium]